MNARLAPALAWSLCLVTLALLGAGVTLWAVNGFPLLLGTLDEATGGAGIRLLGVLTFALIAVVALLIATRRRTNPIGWILLIGVVVSAFDLSSQSLITYALPRAPSVARLVAALAFPLNVSAALVAIMLLLFPSGRLPSPRWAVVLWLAIGAGALQAAHRALRAGPLRMAPTLENPFGLPFLTPALPAMEVAAQTGLALALLLAAASLVRRWQHTEGEERQQLRWIAYTVPPWAIVFAAAIALPQVLQSVVRVVYFLVLDLFVIALGVALLKYRLYDIDIVINKAIVYGALGAFITGVYVAVVFGISAGVDATGEFDVWLSLLATVIVAVAFQPVRERAQRLANQLIYGRQVSPHEALADFARRMAEALSADEVLPRMAQAVGHGSGADRVRVRVYVPGGLDRAVAWPPSALNATFDRTVRVMNHGELLGDVSIGKPTGAPRTPAEDRLLADFAAQAGPAFIRVQLDVQLQAQLAEISAQAIELRASRQRIVAAQDIERRRLERDIHDGAQQHLVALAVNARLALELVRPDPGEAESLLAEIGSQAGQALATLRDLARGIFPAVLADRGLAAALEAQLTTHPTAKLVANGTGEGTRFEREVEAAVYFCCLEALQNCAKHAPGAAIAISLSAHDSDWLEFAITDDGPGFDADAVSSGSGRQNMADRLAAIDGSLAVSSAPGQGTIVSGRVPARVLDRPRPAPS